MERDQDVMPGAKLALRAALILGGILLIGSVLAYPIAWGFSSHRINKMEIGVAEFFGKVADPNGNPIEGVQINAKLLTYSFFGSRHKKEFRITTDENEEFSFGPRKAITLQLYEFAKPGYKIRGRRWPKEGWFYWVFRYTPHSNERFIPDLDTAFVFTMESESGP